VWLAGQQSTQEEGPQHRKPDEKTSEWHIGNQDSQKRMGSPKRIFQVRDDVVVHDGVQDPKAQTQSKGDSIMTTPRSSFFVFSFILISPQYWPYA
jgi:hypothetical protein